MRSWGVAIRRGVTSLIDPVAAAQMTARDPRPWSGAIPLLAVAMLLGAATLPRQLAWLNGSLAPTGQLVLDLHHAALRGGLIRIVVADRLVPPPTILVTAVLLFLTADPVLSLAENRRRALWAVILLGLTPVLVQRLGELAVTYLAVLPAAPHPGDAVGLPQRFVTGPLLLWARPGEAPAWLVSTSQRLNLVSVWSAVTWTAGLAVLDNRPLAFWHVALPVGCLAGAALGTWWLNGVVAAVLLGGP